MFKNAPVTLPESCNDAVDPFQSPANESSELKDFAGRGQSAALRKELANLQDFNIPGRKENPILITESGPVTTRSKRRRDTGNGDGGNASVKRNRTYHGQTQSIEGDDNDDNGKLVNNEEMQESVDEDPNYVDNEGLLYDDDEELDDAYEASKVGDDSRSEDDTAEDEDEDDDLGNNLLENDELVIDDEQGEFSEDEDAEDGRDGASGDRDDGDESGNDNHEVNTDDDINNDDNDDDDDVESSDSTVSEAEIINIPQGVRAFVVLLPNRQLERGHGRRHRGQRR